MYEAALNTINNLESSFFRYTKNNESFVVTEIWEVFSNAVEFVFTIDGKEAVARLGYEVEREYDEDRWIDYVYLRPDIKLKVSDESLVDAVLAETKTLGAPYLLNVFMKVIK